MLKNYRKSIETTPFGDVAVFRKGRREFICIGTKWKYTERVRGGSLVGMGGSPKEAIRNARKPSIVDASDFI